MCMYIYIYIYMYVYHTDIVYFNIREYRFFIPPVIRYSNIAVWDHRQVAAPSAHRCRRKPTSGALPGPPELHLFIGKWGYMGNGAALFSKQMHLFTVIYVQLLEFKHW